MRVVSIVGARPEFVQAAPVSRALRTGHDEILVHTGQHYDYEMSAVFFHQLGLPEPDYNLGVGSGSHAWQTGQMLIQLEKVLLETAPDWVIVRGDTNSTLAGALASVKLGLPLVHIEAGLRSFDKTMPEETNRVITDRIADILFCPTQTAVKNLSVEGISNGVYLVGDVMYDGLLYNLEMAERESSILKELDITPKRYLLATVHRAGNVDNLDNLGNILNAFSQCGETIIFPVHPRTRKQIEASGFVLGENIQLHEPMNHVDILVLQKNARLLLTDSGGMQKEIYCLRTPCITLREQTEWVETVDVGWNILSGANTERILELIQTFTPPEEHPQLYGDGKAAEKIVDILLNEIQ